MAINMDVIFSGSTTLCTDVQGQFFAVKNLGTSDVVIGFGDKNRTVAPGQMMGAHVGDPDQSAPLTASVKSGIGHVLVQG